jgi:hypothetical protein
MEVSGQLHAPAALPPGKEPQVPLDRRLDGPQRRSGRRCRREKFTAPPGIEPRSSSPGICYCTYLKERSKAYIGTTILLTTYKILSSVLLLRLISYVEEITGLIRVYQISDIRYSAFHICWRMVQQLFIHFKKAFHSVEWYCTAFSLNFLYL